jgi:hypothetical protein
VVRASFTSASEQMNVPPVNSPLKSPLSDIIGSHFFLPAHMPDARPARGDSVWCKRMHLWPLVWRYESTPK